MQLCGYFGTWFIFVNIFGCGVNSRNIQVNEPIFGMGRFLDFVFRMCYNILRRRIWMTDSEKLDLLLKQFEVIQGNMDTMHGTMDKMQEKITDNKSAIKSLQRDVVDIRLTLENETNRNIMRDAEGHLDLSRKLDEVLKIDNEKKMMAIRLTIQENELKRLKDKVDQIA